jgi:hypothetical protein
VTRGDNVYNYSFFILYTKVLIPVYLKRYLIKGLPGQKNENPFQIGGPERGTPKRYLKNHHMRGVVISQM